MVNIMPKFYSQFIQQLNQLRGMIKSSDKDMFEDEIKDIKSKVLSDDRLNASEKQMSLAIIDDILAKFN